MSIFGEQLKMKKQITIITLGILMLASAMAMYSGESMTFETDLTEPIYYYVVGNQSDMTGLNASFENGNITISTQINFKPDNFTMIFFNEITNEVIKEVHHYRSGGHKTKYVDRNITQNQTVYITRHVDTNQINQTNHTVYFVEPEVVKTNYKEKLLIGFIILLVVGVILVTSKFLKGNEQIKNQRYKRGVTL